MVPKRDGCYGIIQAERNILEIANGSPFLTHLYAAFQTDEMAYFVMEYFSGGSLHDFIHDNYPLSSDTIR